MRAYAEKKVGMTLPSKSLDAGQSTRVMVQSLEEELGKSAVMATVPAGFWSETTPPTDKAKTLRASASAAGVSPCAWADWIRRPARAQSRRHLVGASSTRVNRGCAYGCSS